MIKLPSVFSSGALYQQNSVLNIRGTSCGAVEAVLSSDTIFSSSVAEPVSDGNFTLTLSTPAASLSPYTITLTDRGDNSVLTLDNILFGELWLASGQSNMELQNLSIDTCEEYLDSIIDMPIRIYYQNVLANKPFDDSDLALPMPIEPTDILEGKWCDPSDRQSVMEISAVATAFAKRLYQLYKQNGQEIPVGFLNSTIGGTRIEAWLPIEDIDDDDESAVGNVVKPAPETWNTFEGGNFQQTTALYNLKIHPLRGVKTAGVLWYQGESNIGRPQSTERYKRYLNRYHNTYSKLFAAKKDFPMVMSLLYPYPYGNSGECRMTCINNAMSEMARDNIDRFLAVPIHDLSPIWGYEPCYHPIHPTNKYPLGERMAEALWNRFTAPTLKSVEANGNKLLLTFDNLDGELTICGNRLRGLYIRGEGTEYLEAEGTVVDGDKLCVWHKHIAAPVHAAYQAISLSLGGNLFGRHLAVAPFATEDPHNLIIQGKPWLFTDKNHEWFTFSNGPADPNPNIFMHPVWQPIGDCELCTDPVFKRTDASLRLCGETSIFGAYVKSRPYNDLDLQNYAELHFTLLNAAAVSEKGGSVRAELHFVSEQNGEYILTRYAERISEPKWGWAKFRIVFGTLPDDKITRLALVFDTASHPYKFVNIDELSLVPKLSETAGQTLNTDPTDLSAATPISSH